jgi:RNA recognition motif-containing protein
MTFNPFRRPADPQPLQPYGDMGLSHNISPAGSMLPELHWSVNSASTLSHHSAASTTATLSAHSSATNTAPVATVLNAQQPPNQQPYFLIPYPVAPGDGNGVQMLLNTGNFAYAPGPFAPVQEVHDHGPKQLIVNFLDPEVTNAELHTAFSAIGALDAARVIYDKTTSKSKGFGFVYYKSSRDAATAMQCMSGHPLRGKRVKVSYANPQRPMKQ